VFTGVLANPRIETPFLGANPPFALEVQTPKTGAGSLFSLTE